ncbi:hypothetical protein FQZ97_893990 [compost metagenome]
MLHLAQPSRGFQAGVLVDDGLEVGWQRVVLGLVHGQDEGRGVQRAARRVELAVELGQFLHLDGRHHFPGDHAAVDDAFGKRVRNLRQGHAHGRSAEVAEHLGDLAGRAAHLGTLEVFGGLDLLVAHVEHARAMHLQGDRLHFLELVLGDGLHVFPVGLGGGFGVVHHERQLEYLDAREAARRVARQRPDDVDDAVARLVVQLHRRATELHGGVGLELDATARVLLDLVHPGLVHVQPHVGLRCHEGVELERDALLGHAHQGGCAECHGGTGLEQGSALDHEKVS